MPQGAALQAMYDASTGLFPSTGWWNSANALTALIDDSARTKTSTYVSDVARGPGDPIGLSWSQAFDSGDAARQGSALDALNAAAQAFDGTVTTKWCSGAATGSTSTSARPRR